jgi:hypothetical protein
VERRVSRAEPRSHPNPTLTRSAVLQRFKGKDASKPFWKYHNESILKKYKKKLQVGSLDTKKVEEAPPPPEPVKEAVKPVAKSGPIEDAEEELGELDPPLDAYGDLVPYADPNWYQTVRLTLFNGQFRILTFTAVPLPILQPDPRRPPSGSPYMG